MKKKIANLAGEMNLSHVSMWKKSPRVWKGEAAYSEIGKTCDEGDWTSPLSVTFKADHSDFSLPAARQISLICQPLQLFALFSLWPL